MSPEVLPDLVQAQGQQKWEHFLSVATEDDRQWLEQSLEKNPSFKSELNQVWACSEFVAASCTSRPELLKKLVSSDALNRSFDKSQMLAGLQAVLSDVSSEDELMCALRQFRQQQMVRIIWRDFTRKAAMTETTADMTNLAEAVLDCALDFLYPAACKDWGTPIDKSGKPQQLVVLGMGKMGAWELNVSSDIDLIFAYPDAGETRRDEGETGKTLTNQEFFIRLGQRLIKALVARTADGFVFRVDMRLRPYGQSGALVLNFDAMEEYYQTQGRDWERYAMIKARVVAGDQQAGQQLMNLLRPFTYRKYIDFTAIEALRDMKALINREVQRKGMVDNIKRGAGGIREVEFIAQAFQIIRGGRDSRFQQPALQAILQLLDSEGLLPEGKSEVLAKAYIFLRNVEHAVQGWQDQQTQMLPGDEMGQQRLAFLMECKSWDDFCEQLDQHRQQIREVFENIIAEQNSESAESTRSEGQQRVNALWNELGRETDTEAAVGLLGELGYDDPEAAVEALVKLHQHRALDAMLPEVRSRLDTLMPRLIMACSSVNNDAETLIRILPLIEGVLRRSAYLLLLVENPKALQSLARLCSASSWVAKQLASYPALLDELLDPRTLYSLPSRADLEDELRQQILRIPEDDLESLMDTLRYFRRSHSLRVAACEIEGTLPLMKVSDYLTWLAEAILSHVYQSAWEQMVERYGSPVGSKGGDAEFIVVGYGKLGGIELGHGSDLDMVFIYDAKPNSYTDGERSVDVTTFFTRLGQRMIHILTAQTASGTLYEADMRLRPSGNSGMLVTTLSAFEKYQQNDAWVWEHQALVRARPVAGAAGLAAQFETVRQRILCQPREEAELKREVQAMREKMREHLGSKSAGESEVFHLKQDRGGIVDIEFLVQYHALRYAHEYPALVEYPDNVRILEAIEQCELLPENTVKCLNEAYIFYRSLGHRLNLQGLSNTVDAAEAGDYRQQVAAIWEQVMDL